MTITHDWSRMLGERLARIAQDARLTKEFLLKEAVAGGGSFMPDDAGMRRGFLADILAHPEDDTPRLIFADWLQDHGEEAYAEFIRVQCELPQQEADGTYCYPLRRREAELMVGLHPSGERNRIAWAGELVMRVSGKTWEAWPLFRRGFVEEITCTSADWLAHAGQLLASAPIRRVRLTTHPEADWITRHWTHQGGSRKQRVSAMVGGRVATTPLLAEGENPTTYLLEALWPGIAFDLPSLPTT